MAFKIIPKGENRSTKKKPPHITITNRGALCISTYAVELLTKERNYEYAFLLWDADKKIIAIRPTRRKDDRAYRITYSVSGRDAHISGVSFCQVINYDYSRSRSYLAQWNDAEHEFRVDLKNEMFKPTTKGTRGPKSVAERGDVDDGDLLTWYDRAHVCARLRISDRTLERFVRNGMIEKRYRRVEGRMAEPVFKPEDVDAILGRKKAKTG